MEPALVSPAATDQAWSQGKRGKSQISKSILAILFTDNTLDGPQDPSICARSQVYWNQGNDFHGLEKYRKSCGSHSLFLSKRFCLGKIYDSNLQSDANTSELLHVCKALLLTWGSEQKNHKMWQPKAPNKPLAEPLSWFLWIYSLKTWTTVWLQKDKVDFRVAEHLPLSLLSGSADLRTCGERMNKDFRIQLSHVGSLVLLFKKAAKGNTAVLTWPVSM